MKHESNLRKMKVEMKRIKFVLGWLFPPNKLSLSYLSFMQRHCMPRIQTAERRNEEDIKSAFSDVFCSFRIPDHRSKTITSRAANPERKVIIK